MSTLKQRMAEALRHRESIKHKGERVSQAALARACGVTAPSVSGWFTGETKSLEGENLVQAAAYLKVRPEWLGAGKGPMTGPPATFDVNVVPAQGGRRPYPVISSIQAGLFREITTPYGPGDGYDIEYADDDASSWAFFLDIQGDSMLPDFKPGDRVFIDPEVMPRPGDFVAARNSEQEATFKKYRVRGISPDGKEVFDLVPLNDNYPTMKSDEHVIFIIGTMIEHRRRYRR